MNSLLFFFLGFCIRQRHRDVDDDSIRCGVVVGWWWWFSIDGTLDEQVTIDNNRKKLHLHLLIHLLLVWEAF